MNIKNIVDLFGGQTRLAQAAGVRQSAVAYWVKKGAIPEKWHAAILASARAHAIELEPHQLRSASAIVVEKPQEPAVRNQAPEALPSQALVADVAKPAHNFMFYSAASGKVRVQVMISGETVWASQRGMAEIFGVEVPTVHEHLRNIFSSRELDEEAVIRNFLITAADNKNYDTRFYNLDAIISVGYRVNSHQATQFRRWATELLREYLIKGFVLDDERLKQGKQLFDKDYFDELLDRIREIRASERRFYQKITDIYSKCSIDYDKDAPLTQTFYAQVQDKLHYAVHQHTSAELIKLRANAQKPNMGLTSYKNQSAGGKITQKDVTVGKNYLHEAELQDLNRLVGTYLDIAEGFMRRQIPMRMQDWIDKLNEFLRFSNYPLLANFGSMRRESAEQWALAEYEKFKVSNEREERSDFDEAVEHIQTHKRLPKSS
jgi:hypothetical protein